MCSNLKIFKKNHVELNNNIHTVIKELKISQFNKNLKQIINN